jgi:hypothetical protein
MSQAMSKYVSVCNWYRLSLDHHVSQSHGMLRTQPHISGSTSIVGHHHGKSYYREQTTGVDN